MKVSLIGGGGRGGSCTAAALQAGGVVDEIALLDSNAQAAADHAADLMHGASLAADQRIYAADYPDIADSDLVVIATGIRAPQTQQRLDCLRGNVDNFLKIIGQLKSHRLQENAIILVVSEPVDVLTRLAAERMGQDKERIIGLGTLLDSTRFSSLIASELKLPATQVRAMILGGRGSALVPIWSSATINGFPLVQWPGLTQNKQNELVRKIPTIDDELNRSPVGAGWAVGLAVREVVETVALDRRRVLPISSMMNGNYGIHKTCLSVPTMLGRHGVVRRVDMELWPREVSNLRAAAATLDELYRKLAG